MKIAVVGKGGVGKTTISGLLCMMLGKKGIDVLAIDGDPNPNLGLILGLDKDTSDSPVLSSKILEMVEGEDGRKYSRLGITFPEVIDTYGKKTSDNITLLTIGQPEHAGTGCMCGSHTTVREVVHSALAESKQVTILDTEASLEHMKRGTSRYVDVIYIVVEPYYRSLEAGARFQRLGKELDIKKIVAIANKVKSKEDEAAIIQFCEKINLPVEIIIPYDETIAIADKGGDLNMYEIANSRALQKIEEIAEKIILQLN